MGAGALSGALLALVAACGPERPGDTTAAQRYGRWYINARLTAGADSQLTIARLGVDSGTHDVLIVRYEFDQAPGLGDEIAVTIGMDLGVVRQLRLNQPHPLGPGGIPTAFAVTCLCDPLRPDSVVGTVMFVTRGLRQLTGRIDATFYSSVWNDPGRQVTHVVHQRVDGIRWE